MEKSLVDEIVLLGGSSHIPKVQQLVKLYFDGKQPIDIADRLDIDPAEAATQGAAQFASI